MPAPNATDIRLAVASQPTIGQSITAMLAAFVNHVTQALGNSDPNELKGLIQNMSAEPKAWSDAVLANTPHALESATLINPVPAHVADAFTIPGAKSDPEGGSSEASPNQPDESTEIETMPKPLPPINQTTPAENKAGEAAPASGANAGDTEATVTPASPMEPERPAEEAEKPHVPVAEPNTLGEHHEHVWPPSAPPHDEPAA